MIKLETRIAQLVSEAGGNEYDLRVAAMMYRIGGKSRARKYVTLLQGPGQQRLPGMNRTSRKKKRSNACK